VVLCSPIVDLVTFWLLGSSIWEKAPDFDCLGSVISPFKECWSFWVESRILDCIMNDMGIERFDKINKC